MFQVNTHDTEVFRSLVNNLSFEFNSLDDGELNEIMFYLFTNDSESLNQFDEGGEVLEYLMDVCADNNIRCLDELIRYYSRKLQYALGRSSIDTITCIEDSHGDIAIVYNCGSRYIPKFRRSAYDMEGLFAYADCQPHSCMNIEIVNDPTVLTTSDNSGMVYND